MNSCKIKLLTCFFVIVFLLFLNCGASHKLIDDITYKDESFSYSQLKNNGLVIAGMGSGVPQISSEEQFKYGSTLSNVLIQKLPDVSRIAIINPMQLISKMGKNDYDFMLAEYNSQKALSRAWADTLGALLPDARFILFAYLVNENIVDESQEQYIESEQGEEIETEYRKTYYLTVEFHLYDLMRKELVWENSIFNKAERTESRTTESGCLESCMSNLFQDLLFGEPAEIGREEVFAKIVEKFAQDFAKS